MEIISKDISVQIVFHQCTDNSDVLKSVQPKYDYTSMHTLH